MSISDNRGTYREDEYLASLPEAQDSESVLRDFLNDIRRATSLTQVNTAAGIAYQRLVGKAE